MRKVVVIICNLILICSISNFCYAQTLDENATAKEVESLKLKTGQLIEHEEISNIDYLKSDTQTPQKEVFYSYIGAEVDNANNILFEENANYSNTEKLDDTHFRIYAAPKYYKGDDNIVHKIERSKTSIKIWNEANVSTLIDKITNLLKTPYAIAGTSYGTNDNYLASYKNSSWYDVRTATTADAMSTTIVAYNWYQTFEVEPTIYYNFRTPINFDLTLINSENILSGSINLYSSADTDAGDLHSYAFYKGTQALPATLDDYNNYEDLQYTDIIDNEDIANSSFNSWTLNNDGIEYLKTGVSTFMFMEATYDIGSSTPPDYSTINNGRSFTNSLDYDIIKHPYIELEVSGGTGTTTALSCDYTENTDISVITGCSVKVDSTGTTTTFFSYYSPFILYLFVYGIIFIILFLIYLIYYTFKK